MSDFNLDGLMASYNDYARNYLFYAKITPPSGINFPQKHHFLVSSSQLPPEVIGESTINWQGNVYRIANTHEYSDHTITFRSDENNELRAEFLKWMKKIHDPTTNIHGSPSEQGDGYFGTVTLDQLDNEGNQTITYQLIAAFPSNVGEVSLDYGNKDVTTFQVTFKYQYHTVSSQGGSELIGSATPTGLGS